MDYNALRRYVTWFTNRGWRDLDPGKRGGIFCQAILISPCNTMVAKFCDVEPEYGRVDAWPFFIHHAATHYNPHHPKIYQARVLHGNVYLGIVERLYHLPVNDYDFTPPPGSKPEIVAACREAKTICEVSMNRDTPCSPVYRSMSKTAQAFFKACMESIGEWPNDLHVNNIMFRRTVERGIELVFNDPIASVHLRNDRSSIW